MYLLLQNSLAILSKFGVNSLKLVNIHQSSSHISVPNAYILTGP